MAIATHMINIGLSVAECGESGACLGIVGQVMDAMISAMSAVTPQGCFVAAMKFVMALGATQGIQ